MPASLQKSEWVFFYTVVALVISLYIIAKQSSFRSLERLRTWEPVEAPPEIWIEISGHVQHPGRYKLRPGANLECALRKAKPKSFADLSQLDLTAVPEKSVDLEIRPCQTIRVRVAGCVKEVLDLELAPGSRISDLKGKVELSPEADRSFFRKRRVLKNGEVVDVPLKHK